MKIFGKDKKENTVEVARLTIYQDRLTIPRRSFAPAHGRGGRIMWAGGPCPLDVRPSATDEDTLMIAANCSMLYESDPPRRGSRYSVQRDTWISAYAVLQQKMKTAPAIFNSIS